MHKEIQPSGTKKEIETFHEVDHHYTLAKQDLETRTQDFDRKDELFRSYINKSKHPYNSVVFDPRVFTAVFEKTSRLFANKLRGRMVPREGGDALGAMINNQILEFQWDDVERVDNWPMIAKWAMMDQNARKYGAAFGLVPWHFERQTKKTGKDKEDKPMYKSVPFYDGPNFVPLTNRDCLPNPSYSTIKHWFQHRKYVTLDELTSTNDAARSKPVYKNLDILRDKIKERMSGKGGDRRDNNYTIKNKTIKGLQDYLGQDEAFKTIEIITEYRKNRWITFAPKHGVVIRDIDNPYDHGQIPITVLKYYPIDDDIYGLSEIEPVERLQKAVNALINQYLDSVNMSLYAPLKVRATGVQMHTLEFAPGKKWIMNDPGSDVITHDQSITGISEFTSTYSFMISAMQSALGEASQGISSISPFDNEKTATEVRDTAVQRNARDNFNQIYLSQAIKKQMMFWHLMNRQFMFSDPRQQQKIIRIVGKEAIRYFQKAGLDGYELPEGADQLLATAAEEGTNIMPQDLEQPIFPVEIEGDNVPKFNLEETGEMGSLVIEPEDLSGTYDYIPDVESMKLPTEQENLSAMLRLFELATNPVTTQGLLQEGYSFKYKEFIEDTAEKLNLKDAEKYFEKGAMNELNQGGVAPTVTGQAPAGNVPEQGMAGGAPTAPAIPSV